MYSVPGTAVVSVKNGSVMAGESGVISVEALPMPRKMRYRVAPAEAFQERFTPPVLAPLEARKPVGVGTALEPRDPVSLLLAGLSSTPDSPTAFTAYVYTVPA
ncbi:MAG: hypothetical protein EBR71_11060, partial [Planctomycetes bacterium]|nr:hypothetical protein [Planctomycetota bacterium]